MVDNNTSSCLAYVDGSNTITTDEFYVFGFLFNFSQSSVNSIFKDFDINSDKVSFIVFAYIVVLNINRLLTLKSSVCSHLLASTRRENWKQNVSRKESNTKLAIIVSVHYFIGEVETSRSIRVIVSECKTSMCRVSFDSVIIMFT